MKKCEVANSVILSQNLGPLGVVGKKFHTSPFESCVLVFVYTVDLVICYLIARYQVSVLIT